MARRLLDAAPMMRSLRLLALAVLALPAAASAQTVYIAAPPVPPMPPLPPPVYVSPGVVPPHVYIRERIRWHLRRVPRVVVVATPMAPPPPPTVYVAPPPPPVPPPPIVYSNPEVMPLPAIPPPIVVPPPCCYAQPVYAPAPEVVLVKPRPPVAQWKSRIGLGVRGTGAVIHDGWNNLGIGGEFLFRASPHLVTELAAEYDRSAASRLDRVDVPVTIGLRVHIGRPNWVVSPYFVFAGGVDIAAQDLKFTEDKAFYLDGQIGGGLELRLGQHVAITADARLDAKKRVNSVDEAVAATSYIDGKPVHALGNEVGGQFRLGVAAYF
jgi:hypothetical protein